MGFLAAIPYTTGQNNKNKKTINKLNKAFKDVLGFDLVERLMQVSMGFFFSHQSQRNIIPAWKVWELMIHIKVFFYLKCMIISYPEKLKNLTSWELFGIWLLISIANPTPFEGMWTLQLSIHYRRFRDLTRKCTVE